MGPPGTGSEPALGASYEDTYGERPVGQAGDEPALVAMPAAEDVRSFAELYRIRASQTSKVSRWLAVSAVVAIAGPLGIVGALGAISAQVTFFGLLAIVFFGPAVEEISKVMGAVVLIERYPWLIPAAWVIPVMTITGGLGFAVIENWVYLNIYIADPTPEIIRWRWIFGPLVHGISSLLVGIGLMKTWIRVTTRGVPPTLRFGQAWIFAGIAFHGSYNFIAVILELTDAI